MRTGLAADESHFGQREGRRLKGPPGPLTRPMADKIREALFRRSLPLESSRCDLDLYAGTGSVGIEALPRGQHADFVDQQKAACAVIRSNLEQTKFTSRSNVHCMPIAQFLRRKEEPYDFVILDPPYADPNIVET